MTDVDEIEWPAEALEPAVIGDQLADEGFERGTPDDDQAPAAMTAGVEYWERGKLGPLSLCGTDVPGGILFLTEPEAQAAEGSLEPLFGDWDTPLPMLPPVDELAERTHPSGVEFLDNVQTRTDAAPVDPASRPVSLDDVAGLFGPDWTGGMDSVDWVRAQRDDAPLTFDPEETP